MSGSSGRLPVCSPFACADLIPSTARSTSSAAAPLPPQLVPLLLRALENAKVALDKVLPPVKRVNVLEEAEFVDVDGGFEKEKMLQCMSSTKAAYGLAMLTPSAPFLQLSSNSASSGLD